MEDSLKKEPKKKILIIEDDKKFQKVLSIQLKQSSYDVLCVTSLVEFLEAIKKEKIDMILLDLGLPDSSGLETFRKVFKQGADIPIVILTGLDDEKIAIEAVKEGAQDYLVKGEVDNRTLIRSLNYAFERSKLLLSLKKMQEIVLQSERLKVLVETAGAAAHEINQPLTSIIGMAEILKKDLTEHPSWEEKINFIINSALRIKDIVKKMANVKKYVTKPYLKGIEIVDFKSSAE
ncbi:MAG: response regulator [candidate division WOR-3 bacterium]